MTDFGDSRWQKECFRRCGDCASCLCLDNNNEDETHGCDAISKRFVTVGSVRYGLRLGAVSPPPPGAGPRYRSQCCWPSSPGPGPVSRIPLLATPPINSRDIFSCVNRVRMTENATSELPEQASVRDQVLQSTKTLLKSQLRRRVLGRTQVYTRLCECGNREGADIFNNLDRLPRFRFGGNRGNSKERERDKKGNEQRFRELTDLLKRGPIPPPRTKHVSLRNPQSPPPTPTPSSLADDNPARHFPLRSASFSQVDYSSDDKKYVRKRQATCSTMPNTSHTHEIFLRNAATLPRSKNSSAPIGKKEEVLEAASQNDAENINSLCEMIFHGCQQDNIMQSLEKVTNELRTVSEEESNECPAKITNQVQTTSVNSQDTKRDRSRRRKGMYISQWPNPYQSTDEIPQLVETDEFAQNEEEPASPTEDSQEENYKSHLLRADSLSEGEPEQRESKSDQMISVSSDISDCESRISLGNDSASPRIPRRYSKRPLRGPYGQMLEAEMNKNEIGKKNHYTNELKFLEDLSSMIPSSSAGVGNPRSKCATRIRGASNHSLDDSQLKNSFTFKTQSASKRKISADCTVPNASHETDRLMVSHQRTTSSPSKLEGLSCTEASSELLKQLLKGSSEQLAAVEANLQRTNDTRTHVVVELYDTERSYVESLQILVTKYLEPLKSPENAGLLDSASVDEIFFQIPSLLSHHQVFLEELKKRLDLWDVKQKVGDIFLETFSKPSVIESYTNYVNNWKRARDILKTAQQSKPAFAKFLEAMAREHKGKLALDSLLIKPIQKFPKYELLLQRLIKHTDSSHPDHSLLLSAQREVHEQLLKINCTEREALELEQLREIEGLIEGLIELVSSDRQYIRHDLVSMTAGSGARKERALFLFSDLLLITSIKRRSGTIKRPTTGQGTVSSTLDANKYKLLMRIPLEDLEIVKAKDENLKQMMLEIDNLNEDITILNQINELMWSLHCNHDKLDEIVKDMLGTLNKQLSEQQNSDSQLSCLDLALNASNGHENVSIVFSKPEKRASWEESFNEAKHKLAMSGDRRPSPELVATVPIRKTRAGLQFTCASPTLGDIRKDVWVCNSDGYVGQVCVLSLQPEPTVTSCNGVCNARILCIASVPGSSNSSLLSCKVNARNEKDECTPIHFDSSSSSDDEHSDGEEAADLSRKSVMMKSSENVTADCDDSDNQQSTMWLGTEDGCIHVYNSSDNIRIKKNKIRLQHGSSVLCIVYLDDKVFVALANGDITVYERDSLGGWNTSSPLTVSVGTTTTPVSKMLPSAGKLWCSCGNVVKVFNSHTYVTDSSFTVNNDTNKPIACIVLFGNAVWLSLQNSAIVKCFHALTFESLCEVNVAPAVTKMLTSCDDIIRQHKAACLRVTSLLACKDLLWVGTSAGVLLTMLLPHVKSTTTKLVVVPGVAGVPHGHTGHVRFLTHVEYPSNESSHHRYSYKGKTEQRNNTKHLIISGGDGYEDFRSSNLSEVAGREDSTNHLLLWNI